MRSPLLVAALAAALLLAAGPTGADDLQAWPTVLANGPVRADGLAVWAETQLRIDDDVSHLLQRNARLGLGREWEGGRSLYAGWAWLQTTPLGGRESNEHRVWQQAGFTLLHRGPTRITARLRLEERFREETPDIALRLRSLLRLQHRLGGESAPALVLQSELFTEFLDTRWGARARGYDQVRSFAGVNVPLSKTLAIETGYQNQSFARFERAGPNHIWLTQALFRF